MQIFRSHLARTIRLASPLLIDACTPHELDEAVWRMKPGAEWPGGPEPRVLVRDWSVESRQRVHKRLMATNHANGELDQVELRLGRHTANMVMRIGPLLIHTTHRGGCVFLPHAPVEWLVPWSRPWEVPF